MTNLTTPSLLVLPLQSSSTGSTLPSRTTSYVRFVLGSSSASTPSRSQSNQPCAVRVAGSTVVYVSSEYCAGVVVKVAVTSPLPSIVSKAGSSPSMQPQPRRVSRSSSTTSNDFSSEPQSALTVTAASPAAVPRTMTAAPSSDTFSAFPVTFDFLFAAQATA